MKVKHYTAIDEMPIYNWRKINETNDLRWLFPEGKGMITPKKKTLLSEAWEKIFDSFIDTFGISKDFRRVLELRREIIVLKSKSLIYGDKSLNTMIKILNIELERLLKNTEAGVKTFSEVKGYIEKFMGFQLNERTTTVLDYYTYLNLLQENASNANRRNN